MLCCGHQAQQQQFSPYIVLLAAVLFNNMCVCLTFLFEPLDYSSCFFLPPVVSNVLFSALCWLLRGDSRSEWRIVHTTWTQGRLIVCVARQAAYSVRTGGWLPINPGGFCPSKEGYAYSPPPPALVVQSPGVNNIC